VRLDVDARRELPRAETGPRFHEDPEEGLAPRHDVGVALPRRNLLALTHHRNLDRLVNGDLLDRQVLRRAGAAVVEQRPATVDARARRAHLSERACVVAGAAVLDAALH